MLPEHAPLEGVIGVFNEEGSALALISPDGRITLHDTGERETRDPAEAWAAFAGASPAHSLC